MVEIVWVDASTHGGPGWVDLEDAVAFAEEPVPVMRTIGYLFHELPGPDGWVVITDTLGDDECAAVHKIPNGMVIERNILR
ncbi:MAG: hypothetical protein GY871_11975 [Actinomycetales bacterium]|nr:hypothetical protein [Actinomycetales bacterium]MCP4893870.1 hypothetical protein [Actinomycetales bacterium]